ncbi:GIY-YIG nuclease family protein [Massilia sp. PAMC28688]|uniref:RHS repeat-associated core domain-containing protein n=1 Tax=Massilia sp. PAMC28688 TaxID=2861283 RepID=UPI001C6250BB|nr:RHS repeat-associated core domain-containing protein [Massilia sp. PAMC28688]QYF93556.1 GIY-YIG nuclease family protein [Massilia sp. PAMC28688]
MFFNHTLQRAVSSVLIATLVAGTLSPTAAMAQTRAPAMVGDAPLVPLQAPAARSLPVIDANGIPTGKGAKRVLHATPAAAAARIKPATYGEAIGDLHEMARKAQAGLRGGKGDALAMAKALRVQYAAVLKQEGDMAAGFAATAAHLRANGVPEEIIQRNSAASNQFSERSASLRQVMAALDAAAAGKGATRDALVKLAKWLDQYPSVSGQQTHGKEQLPWGQGHKTAPKVAQTEREHEARFPRSIQLASSGTLSGIELPDAILPDAVQPADLAATADAPATPEIVALAASLGNNPVAINNWVRNQIRFAPGFGAMQGAAATLKARRGNDVDTASLLVALLRAAKIPARYAYGTIEVPAARAQNWLGVDSASAALALLTQAGIPNRSSGGAIQMEHVWVEAFVDYSPSRGAVNRAARTWVSLDASFKQMKQQTGIDLRGAVSLNEAGLFDSARQGAVCTPDYARNLNLVNLQQGYTAYKSQLDTFLAQQGADLTVGQVLGSSAIAAENYSILMGSLPYKVVVTGAVANVMPDTLRWKFKLNLYANSAEQGQENSVAAFQADLSAVADKRLTLSFVPATEADARTLALYLPQEHADDSPVQASEFAPQIPGYLIRVKAEIRLDGALVSSGGSFVLGSELVAESGAFDPSAGNWTSATFLAHAGDYHAVAVNAQGIGAGHLNAMKARMNSLHAKLSAGQTASLSRDDVAGELLYQSALGYFATADANSAVFQRAAGVLEQRLPSFGRAVAQVQPEMVLGIVNNVSFPGVALDIDRASSAVVSLDDGMDSSAYLRQANERNAAYSHQVLAHLFTSASQPGMAVSPVRSLAAAAAAGQTIYAVTRSNGTAVLPQLTLSASAALDLESDVARGLRALVAKTPLTLGGWTGQGIATEDLVSGAGSYRLSGDAGNATAALYPAAGMGWLALASPRLSAATLAPVAQAGQSMDAILAAMLDETASTTRWSFFPGQAETVNGLFLARLAQAQDGQPCDSVAVIMAADLTAAAGFDQGGVSGAPVITSAPVIAAGAGQGYAYPVIASDPQGATLAYSLIGAPTGMTISDSGVVSWLKPVSGSYSVTVRADNGRAYAEQRYQLTVSAEALELTASLVVTPAVVNLGESVSISVVANGGSGARTIVLNVDGQPVVLDASGQASVVASTGGAHHITLSVKDAVRTITRTGTFSVRDLADSTNPVALITSPEDDAELTATVDVLGTATAANFAYYQLLLRPAGSTAWSEIARGTSSVNGGVLGKLDPTQLANGIYELVLMVTDVNGNRQSSFRTVDIYRDLKVGQFAMTFEDLNVEASGIPIRVTRTYDTRTKEQNLDFGFGWTVDYQSVQVRKNMVLGLDWQIQQRQFLLCVVPAGKRKINITMPDGKVDRFVAANSQECAFASVPPVDIKFTALPGTTSKLEIVNVPFVDARGGYLYDMDNLEPWNPKQFKLTTQDSYVYYLTDGIGITRVVDPSGNSLSYGANGIVHSNGQSVAFARDVAGRITAITDPAGKQIKYAYSAAGDLISVTDRTLAVSRFNYNRGHGLTDYTDPTGTLAARYVYDDEGRLVAMYDAEGKAIEMTHDTANSKEIIKDRLGNVTTYAYDQSGNITEKIDALNNKTTYVYDAVGNLISTVNPEGKSATATYHPKIVKPLTETDELGNTVTYNYDVEAGDRLKSISDARSNVTMLGYAMNGSVSISEPLGRNSAVGVDSAGRATSVNLNGRVTTYTYDTRGNKTSETDAAGRVIHYAYDANGRQISRSWTHAVNGVNQTVTVKLTLDAEGRILEETDPLGFVSKFTYNAGGQVTSSTDPQGRVTTYEYNTRGRLAKMVFPDGTSELLSYDAENNHTALVDRQGRTTRFAYDALNRLVTTTRPDGTVTGREYDAVGRISADIDARGKRTTYGYDAAGRLLSVTDPLQKTTRYTYDENGNQTSATDPNNHVTLYKYDALNRLELTTAPDGRTAAIVWNMDGTKNSETDFGGNRRTYGYDGAGRLAKVTETNGASNQETVYGYDLQGNRISQLDAEGRITRWTYDASNRVTRRTLPDDRFESFAYDAAGRLVAWADFAGLTTRYGYSNAGRLSQVVRPDGAAIAIATTPAGMVASRTVTGGSLQNGKTSYTYDAHDRLVRQLNPDGSYLAYKYDAAGNIVERSTAAGTVRYAYDAGGRMESVTAIDGRVTTYTYDDAGRLVATLMPNGVTARQRHGANGRLLELVHTRADGSVVTGVVHSVRPDGKRSATVELDAASTFSNGVAGNPARSLAYVHDAAGRLISEQSTARGGAGVRKTEYAYDKAGNRTLKTVTTEAGVSTTAYAYDNRDRLKTETVSPVAGPAFEIAYTWDDNGNLKSKSTGNNATFYQWDSDNRLIEVKQGATEPTAAVVVKYTYDALGNRVAARTPGEGGTTVVTNYLVDDTFPYAQVVQEEVVTGSAKAHTLYVRGHQLISQNRAQGSSYYHADGQGSVNALTDAAGNTTDTYVYDAFGNIDSRTGSTGNAHRYTGEAFDDATSLQYNRARYYDPALGRFVSQDRFAGHLQQPVTLHKYLYGDADPLGNTDPSGATTLPELSASMNISAAQRTITVNTGKAVLRNIGCELVGAAAEEGVKYGIYVLTNGAGLYYVGQSNDIARRITEHARDEAKKGFTLLAKVAVPLLGGGQAGKDILRIAEQMVMDAISAEGDLINQKRAVSPTGRMFKPLQAIKALCK